MDQIILWQEWIKAFSGLRSAFSRQTTFWWAATFCAGMAVRNNIRGVSSIVDTLGLKSSAYDSLLNFCHSTAIDLDALLACWLKLCFKIFRPICVDGYMVLLGDGIKVPKEGKKMPAVKLMHQSSQSNSKAEYINGHYLQVLSLAVNTRAGNIAAVPLIARIHDGVIFSNRTKKTVINRFGGIVKDASDAAETPAIVVADSYYANKAMIEEVSGISCHLISRVAHNTVANFPAPQPKVRRRGRPAKKGDRIELKSLFACLDGEFENYRYTCVDLYWSSAKRLIRFVVCEHATKGRVILMSTKLDLDPETIIRLYAKRWLIETGFKTALHEVGTFSYHFWMKSMRPKKRRQTKQFLHRESDSYRQAVRRKLRAYHVFLTFSCIVQGLLLHLGINFKDQVWSSFNGWLRTIRKDLESSEIVVSNALSATLSNYLRARSGGCAWAKFMRKKSAPSRSLFQRRVA